MKLIPMQGISPEQAEALARFKENKDTSGVFLGQQTAQTALKDFCSTYGFLPEMKKTILRDRTGMMCASMLGSTTHVELGISVYSSGKEAVGNKLEMLCERPGYSANVAVSMLQGFGELMFEVLQPPTSNRTDFWWVWKNCIIRVVSRSGNRNSLMEMARSLQHLLEQATVASIADYIPQVTVPAPIEVSFGKRVDVLFSLEKPGKYSSNDFFTTNLTRHERFEELEQQGLTVRIGKHDTLATDVYVENRRDAESASTWFRGTITDIQCGYAHKLSLLGGTVPLSLVVAGS